MSKTFAQDADLKAVNDAQKQQWRDAIANSADPEAASNQRQAAYLHRWQEALAYVNPGASLLDIGAGWPIERVWNAILSRNIAYHVLDIGPDEVAEWKTRFNLSDAAAKVGLNTELDFPDASFDVVFSSHCIEHSDNLAKTLGEIRRVLKPGGVLFFAVPFGFDDSPEHMLFLDTDDWIEATTLAGFDVINTHIGTTYPQSGWDLCVVARNRPERRFDESTLRWLSERRGKAGKHFLDAKDPRFLYAGDTITTDRHKILSSRTSTVQLQLEKIDTLLFHQDEWCGTAEISGRSDRLILDTYSRFPTVGSLDVSRMSGPLTIKSIGKNKGKSANIVIHGALTSTPPTPVVTNAKERPFVARAISKITRRRTVN